MKNKRELIKERQRIRMELTSYLNIEQLKLFHKFNELSANIRLL